MVKKSSFLCYDNKWTIMMTERGIFDGRIIRKYTR